MSGQKVISIIMNKLQKYFNLFSINNKIKSAAAGSVKDNYPKYVISMTPYMDSSKWEGIIHIPFAVFLKKVSSKNIGDVQKPFVHL